MGELANISEFAAVLVTIEEPVDGTGVALQIEKERGAGNGARRHNFSGGGMTRWRPCGGTFVVNDVLMWGERAWVKVWVKQGWKRREKTVMGGTRIMAAQVDGVEPGGMVRLTVINCQILSSTGEPLKPLQRGEKIWRRRETFDKGLAYRRVGSADEESGQAIVGSIFVGPEPVPVQALRSWKAPPRPHGPHRGGRGKGPRPRLRPR